jgi:hypothetical protein
MSAIYQNTPYNSLPNFFFGNAYVMPNFPTWMNYTVPFPTFPGDFYTPHYYYPRNDFNQVPNVVCQVTPDNRYCPMETNIVVPKTGHVSLCELNNRYASSEESLAACQSIQSWPLEFYKNQ